MNLRPMFYTVSQQEEAGGVLLSVYQPVLGGGAGAGGGGRTGFVVFADFHGVKTPIMTNISQHVTSLKVKLGGDAPHEPM